MIDDFMPPTRRKPKVLHPLAKPPRQPLPDLDALAANAAARESEAVAQPPLSNTPSGSTAKPVPAVANLEATSSASHKHSFWRRFKISWPPSRRQSIVFGVLAVAVAFGSGALWTHFHRTPEVSASVVKPIVVKPKPVAPTTVASTLSGLQVAPAVNQLPVTGVMIENSPDARPQSGLDQASVVFEAIAEGGITRFLTLFQDTQPDYLGPVRSARPYYVQWCMGFDCSLGHVGGSPEALADIPAWGTKNLDQFANGGAYQRIDSRYAPHNVYTSMDQLNQLEASKGYGASTFTGFSRKTDQPYKATPSSPSSGSKPLTHQPVDTRTVANSIDMSISSYYYNTHYDYDVATNSYKRSEGGAPHMSLHKDGSQVQITPKVVIAMVMQYGLEEDDHHSQYNVIGSGQAFIFQDGTVTTGTWSKADMKSQISFTDAAGKPINLNAGQTWLTALSAPDEVTYK